MTETIRYKIPDYLPASLQLAFTHLDVFQGMEDIVSHGDLNLGGPGLGYRPSYAEM